MRREVESSGPTLQLDHAGGPEDPGEPSLMNRLSTDPAVFSTMCDASLAHWTVTAARWAPFEVPNTAFFFAPGA
jgi:hypothetical protein